jgi:hypothetical protein
MRLMARQMRPGDGARLAGAFCGHVVAADLNVFLIQIRKAEGAGWSKGRALLKALAISLAAIWASSLLVCVVLFWPVLKFEYWRAHQHQREARTKVPDFP